jgi:hypothetical protein
VLAEVDVGPDQVVVPVAAAGLVLAVVGAELVVAAVAGEGVVAGVAGHVHVVLVEDRRAVDRVVALAAADRVVAGAAGCLVHALAPVDDVVAAAALDEVVEARCLERDAGLRPGAAGDRVVPVRGAFDAVVAVEEAGDRAAGDHVVARPSARAEAHRGARVLERVVPVGAAQQSAAVAHARDLLVRERAAAVVGLARADPGRVGEDHAVAAGAHGHVVGLAGLALGRDRSGIGDEGHRSVRGTRRHGERRERE